MDILKETDDMNPDTLGIIGYFVLLGFTVFYRGIGLFKETTSPDPYPLELKENDFGLPDDKENWHIFQSILSTMLEEYKALRAESVQIGSLMITILQMGITIVGVIFGAALVTWEKVDNAAAIYIFYFGIPFFVFFIAILWVEEAARFSRV